MLLNFKANSWQLLLCSCINMCGCLAQACQLFKFICESHGLYQILSGAKCCLEFMILLTSPGLAVRSTLSIKVSPESYEFYSLLHSKSSYLLVLEYAQQFLCRLARAWFLEITFMQTCMCVCAPEAINN